MSYALTIFDNDCLLTSALYWRGIRDRSSSRVQFAPLSTFIISIVEGIVEKLAWKIRFSARSGRSPDIFTRGTRFHRHSKSNIRAYLRIQRRSKEEEIIMSPFTPFENGGGGINSREFFVPRMPSRVPISRARVQK